MGGRDFTPCDLCSNETIGIFPERLCTRHDQTLVIVDTFDQNIVTLPELEMGIELAQAEGAERVPYGRTHETIKLIRESCQK